VSIELNNKPDYDNYIIESHIFNITELWKIDSEQRSNFDV